MARRRFAVALIVPQPVASEIDGLRRALGDRQLGRIDPHVTIIPPINLHDDELTEALAIVAAAATRIEALTLELGPVTTFGHNSPVRFLAVEPRDGLATLHDACWTGVLDRARTRPFHPHVTIDIDGGPTDGRDDPAVELLADYRAEVVIDRVSVLEHLADDDRRRWEVFNSYRFG